MPQALEISFITIFTKNDTIMLVSCLFPSGHSNLLQPVLAFVIVLATDVLST